MHQALPRRVERVGADGHLREAHGSRGGVEFLEDRRPIIRVSGHPGEFQRPFYAQETEDVHPRVVLIPRGAVETTLQ